MRGREVLIFCGSFVGANDGMERAAATAVLYHFFLSLGSWVCIFSIFFCFSGGGLERLGCVVLRRLALRHGSSVDMVCRVWGFGWSGDAHTYGDEQVM